MTPFPSLIDLPSQLRQPAVRDLAWALLSPPLLAQTSWPQRHPLKASSWSQQPDALADWLLRLDPKNPQTAARMSTAFETWTRYDAGRQAQARAALERIAGAPGLSRDLGEMAGRMLAG